MTADDWTEHRVATQLRERFREAGNGGSGRYAFLRQVRSAAGFSGYGQGVIRTADVVTLTLWPSEQFVLTAYEVKVSRSDWLAELRDLEKSRAWRTLADRFVIVTPPGIVDPAELPDGWGLIITYPTGTTRQKVAPSWLDLAGEPTAVRASPDTGCPNKLPRTVVAAMMRSCPSVVPT